VATGEVEEGGVQGDNGGSEARKADGTDPNPDSDSDAPVDIGEREPVRV
jgi:hypothetical protein